MGYLLQVGGVGALGLNADRSASRRAGSKSGASASVAPHGKQRVSSSFWRVVRVSWKCSIPSQTRPNDIRGPYGVLATDVPGTQISELLPMMAERMNRCALIRTLTGFSGADSPRPALTGSVESGTTYGAVVTRLKGESGAMPPYIHLGGKLFGSPGVGGGVFGSACDPVLLVDPVGQQVQLPQFSLAADVSPSRFQQRRACWRPSIMFGDMRAEPRPGKDGHVPAARRQHPHLTQGPRRLRSVPRAGASAIVTGPTSSAKRC